MIGADGVPIGSLGAGEAVWHTDMSYLSEPPDASLLYALEVPPEGGDTWVCSMEAALAALPGGAARGASRACRSSTTAPTTRAATCARASTASDDPRTSVGTPHPIVCAHPVTGRPVLYLGRRRNAYVMGLSLADSEALLDELWHYATLPEHGYAHRWRVGDLLMWDNRSTMHRRDPFDAARRRVMHRTQIKGHARPRAYAAAAEAREALA